VSVNVTVRVAEDGDWDAIGRLFQLYVHDLSQFRGTMPDADGVYKRGRFEERLAVPGLVTLRVDSGERLAGFAMVRPYEIGHVMAEFFIVRGVRRRGVGLAAARAVLRLFPGPWSIPFQQNNSAAARFWCGVATDVAGADWSQERRPVPGKDHIPPDVWIRLPVPTDPARG
jgi:predicted acetyltransferase